MRRHGLIIACTLAGLGALAAGLLWRQLDGGDLPGAGPGASVPELRQLEEIAAAFPGPGADPLQLPRDHGARPDQFAESWSFAGLLRDDSGRRYGFQLAISKVALGTTMPPRASAWATRDIYRGWFSLVPEGQPAYAEERLSRSGLDLAGASASPPGAWLEAWRWDYDEAAQAFRLQAAAHGAGFDLRLEAPPGAPAPIEGMQYRGYWWPRLRVSGLIELPDGRVAVTGDAMLDRLWGRGLPTGSGQLGLTRLWLDLGDDLQVRCEQLRRRTGGGRPLGTCLVQGDAESAEVELEPVGWRSVEAGGLPLTWRLVLPGARQAMELAPMAPDRPENTRGSWSGIVSVEGRDGAWGLLEISNFGAP